MNVAEPLIEQNYGRAAFDTVGPLLLIGWAKVGPGLLQAMKVIEMKTAQPTSVDGLPAADEIWVQSEVARATSPVPALPQKMQPEDDTNSVQHVHTVEANTSSPSVSTMSRVAFSPERGALEGPPPTAKAGERKGEQDRAEKNAREQDLLRRARAEGVLHWQHHQRPISADTLRKRLRVGAPTARRLVAQIRSDTHTQIEGVGNPPPGTD